VQIFGVKEEIPWCRQYAIFTDKFDERLKNAQLGKCIQYTYTPLMLKRTKLEVIGPKSLDRSTILDE
jgi:hypothetical protein